MTDKPRFYTTREAAAYLGLKESTLEKWRCTGAGPVFIKMNGAVRYLDKDLQAFTEARAYRSTSEIG